MYSYIGIDLPEDEWDAPESINLAEGELPRDDWDGPISSEETDLDYVEDD